MAGNCCDRRAKIHIGSFPEILPWASYCNPLMSYFVNRQIKGELLGPSALWEGNSEV